MCESLILLNQLKYRITIIITDPTRNIRRKIDIITYYNQPLKYLFIYYLLNNTIMFDKCKNKFRLILKIHNMYYKTPMKCSIIFFFFYYSFVDKNQYHKTIVRKWLYL